MTRIGILSDTHGWLDPQVFDYFAHCDELWHIGDFGPGVAEQLAGFKPLQGVYGNIDDNSVRAKFPEDAVFEREGLRVWLRHIGGHPPKYRPGIPRLLKEYAPDLHVCGHSHILKVAKDPKRGNLLTLNPGAAGRHGFHKTRTLLRMEVEGGKVAQLQAIELGPRTPTWQAERSA